MKFMGKNHFPSEKKRCSSLKFRPSPLIIIVIRAVQQSDRGALIIIIAGDRGALIIIIMTRVEFWHSNGRQGL